MESRSTKRRQRGGYRFYAKKQMLCSHSDFLPFFPYTLKVTTEAAKGTKMEARGNDDVETTRLIARFVSIRNSCRIFPAFQIAVVSMVLRGF